MVSRIIALIDQLRHLIDKITIIKRLCSLVTFTLAAPIMFDRHDWPMPGRCLADSIARTPAPHLSGDDYSCAVTTARFSATAIANCHRVSSATTIQGHPLQSRQMPTRRATKGVVIRRQQHLKYVSCHCERSKKCCGRRGCGDVKGCCRRYVVM